MSEMDVVSVWLGQGQGRERFQELLDHRVSDDGLGEIVPAPFCRAFGIERYDPDSLGGFYLPRPTRMPVLLYDVAEKARILPDIDPSTVANCHVLLYGCAYAGATKRLTCDGFELWFVGSYPSAVPRSGANRP